MPRIFKRREVYSCKSRSCSPFRPLCANLNVPPTPPHSRRSPLSLLETTVYPRLPLSIDAEYFALHFSPSEDEITFANENARRPSSRLSLLTLLKLFRHLR